MTDLTQNDSDSELPDIVSYHGPIKARDYYEFTVDGYVVPNVQGFLVDGEDTWAILLDGRFCSDNVSTAEVKRWMWLLAHAQAIGAGYACHGATEKRNIYHRQVFTITGINDAIDLDNEETK